MDLNAVSLLEGEIDKSKVPPIHQKRILAFVNHFILTTCTFLNDFLTECECKFIEIERKLQKVEASLIILEEKLASVPDIEVTKGSTKIKLEDNSKNIDNQIEVTHQVELTSGNIEEKPQDSDEIVIQPNSIKAGDDARYRKFFKMLQFGVPPPAVKLKMTTEGLNPEILETPNLILPDGVPYEVEEK